MLRSKRHTLSHNSKGFHSFHSVPATVKPSAPSEFRAAFTVQEETWSEYDSYICSSLTKTKHDNCGHVTSVWTVGSEFTCLLQFVVTAVEWFGGEKSETFRCIRKKRLKKINEHTRIQTGGKQQQLPVSAEISQDSELFMMPNTASAAATKSLCVTFDSTIRMHYYPKCCYRGRNWFQADLTVFKSCWTGAQTKTL